MFLSKSSEVPSLSPWLGGCNCSASLLPHPCIREDHLEPAHFSISLAIHKLERRAEDTAHIPGDLGASSSSSAPLNFELRTTRSGEKVPETHSGAGSDGQ